MARVENHQPKDLGKGAAKPSPSFACLEIRVKVTTTSWTKPRLKRPLQNYPSTTRGSRSAHWRNFGGRGSKCYRYRKDCRKIGLIVTYKLLGKRPNLVNASPANG